MFTGIIHHQGTLRQTKRLASGNLRLSVACPPAVREELALDESIAVEGVCLTVVALGKNTFEAEIMPETLRLTTFGSLAKGASVNLETSLKAGTSVSGHFVMGHVDGLGTLKSRAEDGGAVIMTIKIPRALSPLITTKGSIAVNGVSLTVTNRAKTAFSVALIPHTIAKTTLGELKVGDKVNLEVDPIQRAVVEYLRHFPLHQPNNIYT